MFSKRFFVKLLVIGVTMGAGIVDGQNYPNKPVRIVTSDAGSGSDFAARIVAQEVAGALGQPVVVDNRSSNVVGGFAAKALPDGYTLLVEGVSLWISPLLQKMSYDPVRDFSPITVLSATPWCLVVHPSVAAKSVRDLIDVAKAKPGEINYASAGVGGGAHLAAELFKSMTGTNIVHIPFKGSGAAAIGLVGGQVQLMFANPPAVTPHIKAGKLRALAVTSAYPSALFLGLPTVTASGLPGYEVTVPIALLAPAKTPDAIITQLNQETVRVMRRADIKEKFANIGVESASGTPAELAALIKSDVIKWSKVIKENGINVQ